MAITKEFTVTITSSEEDLEGVSAHTIEDALNNSLAFCLVDASFDVG